jgi:CRP/FNR family transcriptional regulator, cyclic AMP receptor protein
MTLNEALNTSLWSQTLDAAELARVRLELIERTVPQGGFVCRKGEPVSHWVGVIDGLVKLSTESPEGKTATLAGVSSGGWFGEGSLLKTEPRRYDAVALRETRVALMPRGTFNRLLDSSIAFNRFLLNQLNERLAQFIAMIEYERLLDTDARVARCLSWLFNPFLYPGGSAKLEVSQEELGYLAGISRQRVNQALGALEKAGLLRLEYGGITVLDVAALQRYGTEP